MRNTKKHMESVMGLAHFLKVGLSVWFVWIWRKLNFEVVVVVD